MINTSLTQQLRIILPNTNKALQEALKDLNPKELQTLTQTKDLASLLASLLQGTQDSKANDALLLKLLQNNPTLKNLTNVHATIKDFLATLTQDKESTKEFTKLEKILQNFSKSIADISPKELHAKLQTSGIFLESQLKNTQDVSNDLKAVLLQTKENLTDANIANKPELLKHLDKLLLQIDYYQLLSHLSNASAMFIPYSWDALEEGTLTLKKAKEKNFFCDIELKLKEYGELKLRLGLFEKKQLNINITCQSETLKEKLQNNMSELKKQLLSIGIQPKEIRFLDETTLTQPYEHEQEIHLGFEVKA